MYGENQAEYSNNVEENKTPKMRSEYFSLKDKQAIYLGGLTIKQIVDEYNYKLNDFVPYYPINYSLYNNLNMNFQYMGYYVKWDPQECYYYASKTLDFKQILKEHRGLTPNIVVLMTKLIPFIILQP